MRYSRYAYIYLFIILGSYFIIVLYMLQENSQSKSEVLSRYDKAHIENDIKKGILYHHKRHTGLPNYFNNTALPLNNLDTSAYHLVQRIIKEESFHPVYHTNISAFTKVAFQNEDIKLLNIINENEQWIKLKSSDSNNNEAFLIPKFYDFDFVLFNEDRIEHPREKHYSFILSHHLSRLLSVNQIAWSVGRKLNFSMLVDSSIQLPHYRFESRGLQCISLECAGCQSISRSFCANHDNSIEAALVFIPKDLKLDTFTNPLLELKLQFSDSANKDCKILQPFPDPLLFDIVDHIVFEFLSGSQLIRPHLHLAQYRDKKWLFFMDSGYGFGNPFVDNLQYLQVLQSCCKFHRHLIDRLQRLSGGVLSRSVKLLVSSDVLAPLLTTEQLHALDRRLHSVLNIVKRCISHNGLNSVLH